MTALPGPGAAPVPPELGGAEDVEPDEVEPDEVEPDDAELVFSSLSCCANGSLLAKRLKDVS